MSATTFVRMPTSKQMLAMGVPELPMEAFGGDIPPLQRKALVQAMGIRPQKGGGLGALIGVIAAIAIPFAAPAIAGALATSMGVTAATFGLSATVGSVVGSAIVGAGLGAVTAAATGQNVGRGALFGAVGGGIGGYATVPTTASTGTGLTPPPMSGATTPVATGAEGLTGTAYGAGIQVPSLGVDISQFPAAAGTGQYASTSWTPAEGAFSAGLKAPAAGSNVFGAGFGGASTQTAGAATASGWDKFSAGLKAKFTDPKAQADMVMRAAGLLAGSATAGDGLSDEERQLLAQQKQELEQLRGTNQELFNQRLQAAQDLLGESRYFDPEYFGGQSYKAYQNAAARAERDVLRNIAPQRAGLRTAEKRRFALQRSAGGQTAYLQGADMAQQNRIRTTQAGINSLPTSGPTTALSYGNYIGQLYDAADRRRRQTAGDIGDLFGTFTGTPMANKA